MTVNFMFVVINVIASFIILMQSIRYAFSLKLVSLKSFVLFGVLSFCAFCAGLNVTVGSSIIARGHTNLDRARETATAETSLVLSRLQFQTVSLNYGPLAELRIARNNYFDLAAARLNAEVGLNVGIAGGALLLYPLKKKKNVKRT